MGSKRINVVWCDDKFDSVCDEAMRRRFENNGLDVIKGLTKARDLKVFLEKEELIVDAVIVDFNLGEDEDVPEKDSAAGFRYIRDSLIEKYSKKIPFYLYTTWNEEDIKAKLNDYDIKNLERDYFFDRDNPKKFGFNQVEDLISVICQDVSEMKTEAFKIRQQFAGAFAVIKDFKLSAKLFIEILTLDESVDYEKLRNYANSIRKEIEDLSSKLQKDYILPRCDLNKLPKILSGEDAYCRYEDYDRMQKSLSKAFETLLQYIQDGSHKKEGLPIEFDNYLKENNDIYIIKSLAIIALDVISWMGKLYENYEKIKPYGPFEAEVKRIINEEEEKYGAIVYDSKKSFFLRTGKNKLNLGDRVKVESWDTNYKKNSDYFVTKWSPLRDFNGSVKSEPLIS